MNASVDTMSQAPGAPGVAPTWASSDKDLVGTALGPARLWYTLGHGIVNEVYHPRIDIPQIRDLGFIVADGAVFWVEVKRLAARELSTPAPGVPLPRVVHHHPRFDLTLRLCPDPERDVLRLELGLDAEESLRPFVLLAPHLGGSGRDNRAWVAEHRGRRCLWAEQGPFGLALLAVDESFRDALGAASAGYVGTSDGWQDFARNGRLTWRYAEAGPGNVALIGALPQRASLALGLASSKEAAATLALASLTEPFDRLWEGQYRAWQDWHAAREGRRAPPDLPAGLADQWRLSAQVLATHTDKTFTGAGVASLSVPWGNRGEERGGYHLVWPRDLVECAQARLLLGEAAAARQALAYLIATQQSDGHWLQNQWLGGKAYWGGVQLDECAFPVLLAATLAECGELADLPVADMTRRALAFLIREGPASPQDRWEEDAGVNPFTLAVAIAALVAGAPLLPEAERELPLAVADYWNARVEDWCVARGTVLGAAQGVAAHYVREAPPEILKGGEAMARRLPIKNRRTDPGLPAGEQVGTEFLQLVRLGLRRPEDPLIRDTVRLVDAVLRVETPAGPVWRRYTGDGYGEHDDGQAFDGRGRGRGWPLLTGERGHYALAAGEDPLPYLSAMQAMAGAAGLIPEQVWDAAPLPELGLWPGQASGSARPLAWAHAELVKLAASRQQGFPVDRLGSVWRRYQGHRPDPQTWFWTPGAPLPMLPQGRGLCLGLPAPARVRLRLVGASEAEERECEPTGLGLWTLSLPAGVLAGRDRLDFTWRWSDGTWWGRDESIALQP